jgi:hypothetical protein
MLIGHIEKQGRWWVATCEIVGAFTQGRSRAEAMKNLAEVVELRVDRDGFQATVSELQRQGRHTLAVIIEPSHPAWLAIAVLKYQRARHRMSLADVARALGAASRNAYASYEQGAREPTLGKFHELLGAVAPDMTLILGPRLGLQRHAPAKRPARGGSRKAL